MIGNDSTVPPSAPGNATRTAESNIDNGSFDLYSAADACTVCSALIDG
jgi:hypothetical protein